MGTSGRFARFASFVFGVGAFLLFSSPSTALAAYHNVSGWAWSGTTGWISVDCNTDPGGCAGVAGDYGLDINSTGNLSGWAWSSLGGWICFGATCIGATGVPAGGTPSSPVTARDHFCQFVPCAWIDPNTGDVHGWAYVISQTDGANYRGWISLNCMDVGANSTRPCSGSDYGLKFVENATQPAGEFYGYAWNGNGDMTGNGWIAADCGQPFSSCAGGAGQWGMSSGWVDSGWSSILPIEGIYSPPGGTPGSTLSDIPINFKSFSASASSTLDCVFRMSDNTYRQAVFPIATRQSRVDHSEKYTIVALDANVDVSGNPVLWTFSSPAPLYGCRIVGSPSVLKVVTNTVAVHPVAWTFAGPSGALSIDSLRAKYCLNGNTDTNPSFSYFRNTAPDGSVVQCDTEGDLAMTLLRARGVPVEVKCYDTLDNDTNLQSDCAPAATQDRNCRGVTYLCIPHPPASAPVAPRP
jgi:hypothetical protein